MAGPVALSPEARTRALARMGGAELDVLVVGGGVVGAGAALDAATRGLTVDLVEARDWAAGTSSRSSKLIHGGLRYLEMLDFRLVAEALKERGLLLQVLAPHLVRPVPFLYPLQHRLRERPYVGAGVLLYDAMARASSTSAGLPHHRHLGKRRALREAPALRSDALVGAVQYWDAQVDDARHTLFLARTAAAYGALAANRTRVSRFLRQGERVVGAVVTDLESGDETEVRARQVINATGVWTDDTQAMAGTRGQFHVRASKGMHLLVPRDRVNSRTGLIRRGTARRPRHHPGELRTVGGGRGRYGLLEMAPRYWLTCSRRESMACAERVRTRSSSTTASSPSTLARADGSVTSCRAARASSASASRAQEPDATSMTFSL